MQNFSTFGNIHIRKKCKSFYFELPQEMTAVAVVSKDHKREQVLKELIIRAGKTSSSL